MGPGAEDRADPDIRILVPNTKATSLIERQLYENGQPYGVVGKCPECRDKAWSHIKKMEVLLKGCQATREPYVAAMDAFDVCCSGSLSVLKEALRGKQMLLSADHMKWPVNSPGDEKINAGVWFGRTDYVTGWLEKAVAAVPSHPKVVNDQFYYHLLFDPENQRIDYGREFIQTELRPVNIVNDWVKSAYLINLERRADRLRHCRRELEQWPFLTPRIFVGVDGKAHGKSGRWGCQQSHCGVLKAAMEAGDEHVFVLEDDFTLCPGFTEKIAWFLNHVPEDWEILWIGGCHTRKPEMVGKGITRATAAINCHGYVVRNTAMQRLYDFWIGLNGEHIDNAFKHHMKEYKVYCPENFLIGQVGQTQSDISGRVRERTDFWSAHNPPRDRRAERLKRQAIVARRTQKQPCDCK